MNKLIMYLVLLSGTFLNAGGAAPQDDNVVVAALQDNVISISYPDRDPRDRRLVQIGDSLANFHENVAGLYDELNLGDFGPEAGNLSALALFPGAEPRYEYVDLHNFEEFRDAASNINFVHLVRRPV